MMRFYLVYEHGKRTAQLRSERGLFWLWVLFFGVLIVDAAVNEGSILPAMAFAAFAILSALTLEGRVWPRSEWEDADWVLDRLMQKDSRCHEV